MQKRSKTSRIATVFILLGFYTNSVGQALPTETTKANNWRTMVGYARFGGGDISGLSVLNEYNRYLTPHIRIAPNFKFSSAKRNDVYLGGLNNREKDYLSLQATILDFGVMGYYEYLNPNRSGLEIGFGLFYRNLQHSIITGPYTSFSSSKISISENSIGEYSENTFGFNVSIGFIISVSEIINLHFNGILQSDTGSNTGFGGFGGLSIKF